MAWESLGFEDRQKQWQGHLRHFRQHNGRADRPTVWEIRVEGDRVFTRHGLLGGAMQDTNYVGKVKNKGKVNEISAEQDALAEARRDIRKKWDFEGFDEYVQTVKWEDVPGGIQKMSLEDAWKNIDRRNQDVSVQALLTNLPGSFCLYKPENNLYDQKKLLEKANKGEVLYTFKRDGVAKWVVVDYYGNIQIYSRRSRPWQDKEGPKELLDGTLDYSTVVPWSARFPHLIEAVRKLELPRGSMMAVELVMPDRDDFPYVSGLTKGYTQRALEDMAQKGYPSFYWWDIPFLGGEDLVSNWRVIDRYCSIVATWSQKSWQPEVMKYIQPIQYSRASLDGTMRTPELATEYAKKMGFEGWVVVDPDAVYGDKGWNLKGKPDRPSLCAKLKPRFEDDFIALWDPDNGKGTWGTGKHERDKLVSLPNGQSVHHGGVGSVALYQLNQANEMVYICDCASGMDFAFQSQLRKEHFPMVWQVEYVERTYVSEGEKTNALRFPTFLRNRHDKKPEECINVRL